MIGAGGAASGIAFALCRHAIDQLLIFNRSPKKAEILIARLKTYYPLVEISYASQISNIQDLLINATSVGMHERDRPPLSLSKLDSSTLVAEVIIRPEMTCTLKEAIMRGCTIHQGIHMLKAQIRLMLDFMNDD